MFVELVTRSDLERFLPPIGDIVVHLSDDPAGVVIDAALPRTGVKHRHMPALPCEEVAGCIAKVRGSARASESSKLALEFLVLTRGPLGQ